MKENKILEKSTILINTLTKDGFPEEAIQVKDIIEDRVIWDKMIFKLGEKLQLLLTTRKLPLELKRLTKEIFLLLDLKFMKVYDNTIYATFKKLADELGTQGYLNWKEKIYNAIEAGGTSTEIFMAVKWQLEELLTSKVPLPGKIKQSINNLILILDKALKVNM